MIRCNKHGYKFSNCNNHCNKHIENTNFPT